MSTPSKLRQTYRTEWVDRWLPPKPLVGLHPDFVRLVAKKAGCLADQQHGEAGTPMQPSRPSAQPPLRKQASHEPHLGFLSLHPWALGSGVTGQQR